MAHGLMLALGSKLPLAKPHITLVNSPNMLDVTRPHPLQLVARYEPIIFLMRLSRIRY